LSMLLQVTPLRFLPVKKKWSDWVTKPAMGWPLRESGDSDPTTRIVNLLSSKLLKPGITGHVWTLKELLVA
jgi:hypothetical protein